MAHVEKREYWSQAKKPDGTSKRKRLKRWFVIAEDSSIKGKRKRKSLGGFDTKREAERAMPELLRKFYSGEMGQTKETFKEYIDRYLEQRDPKANPGKKHTLKRRTHQDYEQMLNRYAVPLMDSKQLSALTANDFDDVYQYMHNKGLRFSSIRKMHATCHKVMADAVRDRLIQSNPTDRCMNSRCRSKQIQVLASSLKATSNRSIL